MCICLWYKIGRRVWRSKENIFVWPNALTFEEGKKWNKWKIRHFQKTNFLCVSISIILVIFLNMNIVCNALIHSEPHESLKCSLQHRQSINLQINSFLDFYKFRKLATSVLQPAIQGSFGTTSLRKCFVKYINVCTFAKHIYWFSIDTNTISLFVFWMNILKMS